MRTLHCPAPAASFAPPPSIPLPLPASSLWAPSQSGEISSAAQLGYTSAFHPLWLQQLGGGGGGGEGANGLGVIYLSAACLKFACLALGVEQSVVGLSGYVCVLRLWGGGGGGGGVSYVHMYINSMSVIDNSHRNGFQDVYASNPNWGVKNLVR